MLEHLHAFQDLARLRDLSSILIHHGFGELIRRAGVGSFLERAGELLSVGADADLARQPAPVRARLALEAMGPTFVKLGQVLSTRVDLFGPEWIVEFERLQAHVPPVPFEAVLPQMTEALGCPPSEVFQDLDTTPYAAASIAQVYRARLADGRPVVLKVRRPGIGPRIDADLRILRSLAAIAGRELPELQRYRPEDMILQFGRSLARELDLAQEARHQDRFARRFAGDPTVVIPAVHWTWTSPVMNVQDFIEGIPGQDLDLVDRAGLDRKVLAQRGADAVLKMILVDGFFHADPHPGNVLYLPGNRVGMLDFGMVGRLSDHRRQEIVDLLAGLSGRDEHGMMTVLLGWTDDAVVDEERLADDLGRLVFDYEHLALKDIRIGQLLGDITAIMRDHAISLPADLALLFKALITLEGLGRRLDPEFQLIAHLGPFVERVLAERYAPRAVAQRWQRGLLGLLSSLGGLPGDVVRLVRDARRGRMKIEFDLKRLDHFGHQIDRSANRLTVGVVTAALIVGSSIVMTVQGGPELLGLPLFGLLGFLVATLNSIWLVWSIWRARRE